MDGKEGVTTLLVVEDYQGSGPKGGSVESSGCVRPRTSDFRAIALGDFRKWNIWFLGIKNAFLQAYGLGRGVLFRALAQGGH